MSRIPEKDRNPGYMGLKYHGDEAYLELNMEPNALPYPDIAFFSKKYYNQLKQLDTGKKYDYCFIGSVNSCPDKRQWVIDFAKKYFTDNSVFLNTDKNEHWQSLGNFDLTNKQNGFCPKEQPNNHTKNVQYRMIEDNLFYFKTMAQSNFCLCPAGDNKWSFRFYEVLMCRSIPIVESWHHVYRTDDEARINYKYYLHDDYENHKSNINLVNHNTLIFEYFHLLPASGIPRIVAPDKA